VILTLSVQVRKTRRLVRSLVKVEHRVVDKQSFSALSYPVIKQDCDHVYIYEHALPGGKVYAADKRKQTPIELQGLPFTLLFDGYWHYNQLYKEYRVYAVCNLDTVGTVLLLCPEPVYESDSFNIKLQKKQEQAKLVVLNRTGENCTYTIQTVKFTKGTMFQLNSQVLLILAKYKHCLLYLTVREPGALPDTDTDNNKHRHNLRFHVDFDERLAQANGIRELAYNSKCQRALAVCNNHTAKILKLEPTVQSMAPIRSTILGTDYLHCAVTDNSLFILVSAHLSDYFLERVLSVFDKFGELLIQSKPRSPLDFLARANSYLTVIDEVVNNELSFLYFDTFGKVVYVRLRCSLRRGAQQKSRLTLSDGKVEQLKEVSNESTTEIYDSFITDCTKVSGTQLDLHNLKTLLTD
jgi:hypothetical protein